MAKHEKRRNLRRHLLYYLIVLDETTGQPLGRLGDLSHEGLLLLTSTSPELDRTYRLRVMPPETFAAGEVLAVSAQCVWLTRDVNPDLGLAGFRFVDAGEKAEQVIGVLMREFGFADGHSLDRDDEADDKDD
jgi:hypothetical protein